jgi:hypothetical protein
MINSLLLELRDQSSRSKSLTRFGSQMNECPHLHHHEKGEEEAAKTYFQ